MMSHDHFCNTLYLPILNFLHESAYYFEWSLFLRLDPLNQIIQPNVLTKWLLKLIIQI